ncbi:MAG: extracellular solute-binding protein [Actinobacteria bacterium]|nr:extracellular solute-binding protein [Actinomycetota bacterium]
MNRIKIIIITVLVLVFTAGIILSSSCAGAAGEEAAGEEPAEEAAGGAVTLTSLFMSQAGYSEEDVRNITDEFMEANPDIKVDLTFVAYENLHDKIVTSLSSGAGGYDTILIDTVWPAEFASAGFLLDITDKVTSEMQEDIWPAALKAVVWEDRIVGMPWLNDVEYFYYNEKMLKEAGFDNPPATWSELKEQGEVLIEKGIVEHPFIDEWAQEEALTAQYTQYLYAFGGEFFDEDLNPLFNQGGGLEALEFMAENMQSGIINPASTESAWEACRNVFSQGNAAFCVNFTYMWGLANDPDESTVAGDVKLGLMPGEVVESATLNGGMGMGISSKTKYPDEAWKYVEYLSSKDVQKRYAKNALPIWKSLFDDPEVIETQPELVNMSKEQYAYIVNRPIVPWYSDLSRAFQIEIHNAVLGQKTPQQALDDVATVARDLKEKYSE